MDRSSTIENINTPTLKGKKLYEPKGLKNARAATPLTLSRRRRRCGCALVHHHRLQSGGIDVQGGAFDKPDVGVEPTDPLPNRTLLDPDDLDHVTKPKPNGRKNHNL